MYRASRRLVAVDYGWPRSSDAAPGFVGSPSLEALMGLSWVDYSTASGLFHEKITKKEAIK